MIDATIVKSITRLQAQVASATLRRVLRKVSLFRLSRREQTQPVRRYVREHPGLLIHLDMTSLARFPRVSHRISSNRKEKPYQPRIGWT